MSGTITHDYSKKHWIERQEILLPSNAPAQYKARSILWNAVEMAEKSSNAQLAVVRKLAEAPSVRLDETFNLVERRNIHIGGCYYGRLFKEQRGRCKIELSVKEYEDPFRGSR